MNVTRSALTIAAAAAAVLSALNSESAFAQRGLRLLDVPEATGQPVKVSKALLLQERDAARSGVSRDVGVIVRLSDEPLSMYRGGVAGLAATAPQAIGSKKLNAHSADSRRYLAHLDARGQAFTARLGTAVPAAKVTHQYRVAFNGMALRVPAARISALAALPGVAEVLEDPVLRPLTDTSPAFIGAPVLWSALGGQASAGEGVIVGVLDTGIWPEHPSLANPDPGGKPYAAPPGGARPCEFNIGANPGPAASCNNKLIGARRFMATYDAVVGLLPTEFTSARDDNGHGSHTATTAGGNRTVPASIYGRQLGIVSGIAPRAHVMAYKVCGDQGCFGSDSVAAVNAAVLDGVDVINFSISGGANPYSDAVSLAFLGAYNAGVFVAASAGNSGPAPNTTDHREPWTTTVAASTTTRQFESALTLASSDGAALLLRGASVTRGVASPSPVHVPAGDPLCQTPFAAGSVAGKVVVCQRGVNARVDKSYNVSLGGAVGMILVNPSLQGLATDNHFVPSVHLEVDGGNALTAFLAAHPNVSATMTDGSAAPAQGDVMAPFSSRGGTGLTLGIAKPDVTAPGVQILAGATPQPATREGGFPGQLFQAIQGTSMSSPHVAGAAALLLNLHPDWTPGQVKSALMTTASTLVVKEDGVTLSDPFDRGSGRIDLSKAGDPGLLFDETGANYVALQSSLWDANYPSLYVPAFLGAITVQRTVQNTRNAARDWKLSVIGPTDLKVSVPTTISVPAAGSATFSIALDGRGIPLGEKRHAVIELKRPNETTLRFPVTVVRGAATVPLSKACSPLTFAQGSTTQCTIVIANMTFNPANVFLTDILASNQLALVPGSVVNATELSNGLQFSGVLGPAQPPGVAVAPGASPSGGYLPLSAFGVPPIGGVGDDTITNFNVPAFLYGGEANSVIGVSSNGYLVIGGGSGADNSINNQNFPNAARPNNVLAPFWTDLDPGAAGAMRIGTLTDGTDTWIVVDWEAVREFSAPMLASFQVWIGINGDANPAQDISFAYGTIMGNGDGGFLSVGAENRFGNRGATVYFNGAGTLPTNGTQLVVTGTPGAPGETRTITFSAIGKNKGNWTNCAEMTSNAYFGKQTACVSGTVTGK